MGRNVLRASVVTSCASLVLAALILLLALALRADANVKVKTLQPADALRTILHTSLAPWTPAAQPPISGAAGGNDRSYRVIGSQGAYQAVNAAQDLQLHFGRAGVLIGIGAARLALSLRAVGHGVSLRALGDVAARARLNRVVYPQAGLNAWYVNGPLGLEQGFTFSRAPRSVASGPLTLAIAVSGGLRPSLAADRQGVAFIDPSGASLRYGALVASDARGRRLPSWFALRGKQVLIRVDTRDARYPVRVDPLLRPSFKLTGGGGAVALSSDGETALVGDLVRGAALVFVRSEGGWVQEAQLTGAGVGSEDGFACSVALSASGDTALVGAPGRSARSGESAIPGSAWVFTRVGQTWAEQARLTPNEETNPGEHGPCDGGYFGSGFGFRVALSAEGNTALVGDGADNQYRGAAWVFTRSGSAWAQQGPKLTPDDEPGEGRFGASVALSADGNTALVGAPWAWKPPCGTYEGGAWMFTREAGSWTQQGAGLLARHRACWEQLGSSVALSGDGSTALVGSPGNRSALIFARSGGSWSQQGARLTPEPDFEGDFGDSVALSTDASTALVSGIPAHDCGKYMDSQCGFPGAAWTFARIETTWVRQGAKLTGAGAFGSGVALSGVGDIALIGAPGEGSEGGAAFLSTVTAPVRNAFSTGVLTINAKGVIKQQLASSSAGTFSALATVSARSLRHLPRSQARSREKLVIYGRALAAAAGPSVVSLAVKPTSAVRAALAKHRSLELNVHIAISFRPRTGPTPASQTLTANVEAGRSGEGY
jgi:hypothetical protein